MNIPQFLDDRTQMTKEKIFRKRVRRDIVPNGPNHNDIIPLVVEVSLNGNSYKILAIVLFMTSLVLTPILLTTRAVIVVIVISNIGSNYTNYINYNNISSNYTSSMNSNFF